MLRPYMVSAAIIAITTFCLGSYVIPKGSVTRLNFEDKYYKPRKSTTARNIQLEVDSGVIAYIERFEDYSKTGYRFSLDKFKDKQLVSHLTARSITYDTAAVHKWKVKDYMIREMDGMRESIVKGERLDTILFYGTCRLPHNEKPAGNAHQPSVERVHNDRNGNAVLPISRSSR